MFDNTTFRTEAEAWTAVLCEHEAGQRLDARAYERAKEELSRATTTLAESALLHSQALEEHAKWEAGK